MLVFLYITLRLAAFVMIFVCLALAIGRIRSANNARSLPLFLWAIVFVLLSALLAVI